jgi:sarcosine oxidase subunit beta
LSADVAIVGAGITGLSVAFHLAERGIGRIVVYEREGIGAGASGVQPGGVRQQWSTRVNCLLVRDSLAFYAQLGDRLRPCVDPVFSPCGYVFVAHEAGTLERMRTSVALQNSLGVPSRLATPQETAELVPELRTDGVVGASYCAEDGYFDRPQSVVEAFAEAARRLGVDIVHAEVLAVEPALHGWQLRLADGARAEADRIVVAAAVETRALVGQLGVDLPIATEQRWLFYSEPVVERLVEPLVIAMDRNVAVKQLADGRVLASDLTATGEADEASERWRRRLREEMAELLPRLEFVVLPLLVGGLYDVTPDRQALVGEVPGHDGLYVAAGFSGHGFMIAPEVGRGVAAMVLGEHPGEAFEHLRPDRFGREALRPETQVI